MTTDSKPGWLKNLLVDRVDLVPEGANPGAHVALFKSKDRADIRGAVMALAEDRVAKGSDANIGDALASIAREHPDLAAEMASSQPPEPFQKARPERSLAAEIDDHLLTVVEKFAESHDLTLDVAATRVFAEDAVARRLCEIQRFPESRLPRTEAVVVLRKSLGNGVDFALRQLP